ncbi:MAG: efflux transporter outer membrane subunit [bacterium]
MRRVCLWAALLTALSGCAIGPDYERPAVDTPPSWRVEEPEARELANTAWWEQFGDPVLNELIQTALKENKDLKIAAARIEEFYGRYVVTRAAMFPQIGAGATGGRERLSEQGAVPVAPGVHNPGSFWELFLSGSWEIDVWGRLRRATEAAKASLLATEEGRRTVILTLVSSVAGSYVNLRSLDRQLEIAEKTAKAREGSYDLFKRRFEGGTISELELSQVKSLYEQALASIPPLQKLIAQQENALSVLLGRNPGPVPRGKTIDELTLPAVPAGLPSELLERRPDLRQAEEFLVAANAQIGVARAAYFPAISLTGLFGWSSRELSDLFTGPAKTWSWAVPIAQPVFTAGAISGQVKAAVAIQQEALVGYQQVIQAAFREVEDALVDQRRSREQLEAQTREVEALAQTVHFARVRFDNGYTSFIEVLDAERSLFETDLARIQTKGILFQSLVNCYKSMGGGWVVEAEGLAAN